MDQRLPLPDQALHPGLKLDVRDVDDLAVNRCGLGRPVDGRHGGRGRLLFAASGERG
jgi:hypothetical protein